MSCCSGQIKASVTAQVVSATKAASRAAAAVVQGERLLLDDEAYKRRLDVCQACPEVVRYPAGDFMRCGRCGCGLNGRVRAKARLATESCERWPG